LQAAACFFTETVSFAREFQNSHLLHYALGHLANIQVAQSHLRAARQTHEKALAEIQAGSISPYAGLHHAGLGNLNYEWGDLGAAEKHFDQALTLARLWNQWESLLPALSGLARIRRKGDDRKLAYSFLDELKKPPADSQLLSINALRALWKAQDGDSDSAAAWLESSGLTDPYTANPGMEPVLMDVARTLIQLGRLEEGMGLAQKIISLAKPNGRLHMVIQGNILLAKAYSLQDNSNNAIEFLTEALRMAEPEGYLNTFLDEGEPIHILLTKLTGNGYAARLLTGFDTGMVAPAKKGTGSRSTEILSEREQEVIQLVAEGLSNQEIAERLVISLPTVKTHIGNIFNKLGVSSRTRAIASAESLGFIRRD
jgi:LuxR family maltose regulon positive regulatory protein